MTKPFRWKNCQADIATWRHGSIAGEFLADVVFPSLDALDAQIDKWSRSDDPVALFHLNDVEDLRRGTTMAFCLSIQSMWERQIRSYINGCAHELSNDETLKEKALVCGWEQMDALFLNLRGIPLSSFSDYRQLDLLHLLANVCRHGDGPSSKKLWHRCPEFWPNGPSDPGRVRGSTPTTTSMAICRDHLQTFVDAIISFWQEVEYIYLESIERKHESVEKKLLQLRDERAKINRCNFYPRDKEVEPIVDASVCQNIHELTRGSTDV